MGGGGGGGGGGWGGGGGLGQLPIYSIVRMCVPNGPLFQRCRVYDWPPFFNKMYMTDPIFLDWYMKSPTFSDIPVYAHLFHSEIFEAACSVDDFNICLTTCNKWVRKINGQKMNGYTFDDLVYEWVRFVEGEV